MLTNHNYDQVVGLICIYTYIFSVIGVFYVVGVASTSTGAFFFTVLQSFKKYCFFIVHNRNYATFNYTEVNLSMIDFCIGWQ